MLIPTDGYRSNSLLSDITLGAVDGLDGALWGYAFATIIFSGVLSVFLPVGILVILCGTAVAVITTTLLCKLPVYMVAPDEQAIVIIGAIGVLLAAHLGDDADSPRALATLLAVMALTSFLVAIAFLLAARLHVAQFLELLPYPVICGFMAGIGWLLLDAGVAVAIDGGLNTGLWALLQAEGNVLKLSLAAVAGFGLVILLNRVDKSWILPVASISIVASFYIVSAALGWDHQRLTETGWIFTVPANEGGALSAVAELSFADIDTDFIISMTPQLLTILFLTMLSASMNLTALLATNPAAQLNSATEMTHLSTANFLSACIAAPPSFTDAVTTDLYAGFGASSRWMQISSAVVMLIVAFAGSVLISYMPKLLVGATIFLFAFQLFYEWMYENVRSFNPLDYAIVCIILLTVIFFGFMPGILAGIILTVLLFVLRYSMINAMQRSYTLQDHRSSVERSASSNLILNEHGDEVLIHSLQGFLFFGTANTIRDSIRDSVNTGNCNTILLDLRRVTGIDISALNTFAQIKTLCESEDIMLAYSNVNQEAGDALLANNAVCRSSAGDFMIFPETDFALEQVEEGLLVKYVDEQSSRSLHGTLSLILQSEEKADLLEAVMVRHDTRSGEILFNQGDADNGFYLLESGAMTASIQTGEGRSQRVKKFSAGSIIGEMSSYSSEQSRSATVSADSDCTLYHLNVRDLPTDTVEHAAALAAVHELVARTLGVRIQYMNRRLMLELD
jgi:sulfate permease, SulP family